MDSYQVDPGAAAKVLGLEPREYVHSVQVTPDGAARILGVHLGLSHPMDVGAYVRNQRAQNSWGWRKLETVLRDAGIFVSHEWLRANFPDEKG